MYSKKGLTCPACVHIYNYCDDAVPKNTARNFVEITSMHSNKSGAKWGTHHLPAHQARIQDSTTGGGQGPQISKFPQNHKGPPLMCKSGPQISGGGHGPPCPPVYGPAAHLQSWHFSALLLCSDAIQTLVVP